MEAIVREVLGGTKVCAVLYGHPGVFASPGHEAVARVRAAGLPARMLPAISSLDCLFADLGLDPGAGGLQCYEATDFLQRQPELDVAAALVLLQVGMLGEAGGAPTDAVLPRFQTLVARLSDSHGADREAVLYEASPYPGTPPMVARFTLGGMTVPSPGVMATLCVLSRR